MTDIDKEIDISILDDLQALYEKEITNFSLEETEDIYDEDADAVVRNLVWNRGVKTYFVVYNTVGCILAYSKRIPREILVEMMNQSIQLMMTVNEND